MKAGLTRVSQASVHVDGKVVGSITGGETGGILALIGVDRNDDASACQAMARKIAELRILHNETSAEESGASVLVVSQFTLMGATRKGRRPSWSQAAPKDIAEPMIQQIAQDLHDRGIKVSTGKFGAMMQVSSVNEGPFTVLVET